MKQDKYLPRTRTAWPTGRGRLHKAGDPRVADFLEAAVCAPDRSDVAWEKMHSVEGERLFSTHLFHGYTARTHPLLVRALLTPSLMGKVLFDPFVGSGTTLIEAMRVGAKGIGMDINPMAIKLAHWKTHPLIQADRVLLLEIVQDLFQRSLERVKKRMRSSKTWDRSTFYPSHVYSEMCGLREEIEGEKQSHPALYQSLLLIFSSIVIKASHRSGASSMQTRPRNIGKGMVSRWFEQRAQQAMRLHAFLDEQIPSGTPSPIVYEADARTWKSISPHWISEGEVDVVITSPPYLGIYDYAFHSQRSLAWVGIKNNHFYKREMASRRESATLSMGALLSQHQTDTLLWMQSVAKSMAKQGRLYVLIGDSDVEGKRIHGAQPILTAASQLGLSWVATCSAERPDPHLSNRNHDPRLEHLICFEK